MSAFSRASWFVSGTGICILALSANPVGAAEPASSSVAKATTLSDIFTQAKPGTSFSSKFTDVNNGSLPQMYEFSGGQFTTSGVGGSKSTGITVSIPGSIRNGGSASSIFTLAGVKMTTGSPTTLKSSSCTKTSCDSLILMSPVQGLKYSEYGAWTRVAGTNTGIMELATGTPATALPTKGTVNYTGGARGDVYTTNTKSDLISFSGVLKLTANFTSSTILGGISKISTIDTVTKAAGTMNDISFSQGSIMGSSLIGAGTYKGTAFAVGSGPSAGANIAGATGAFSGGFYGPSAAETTGTFSLSGTKNGVVVIGSFGGKR